ncbi:MAG: hypothetical protein ABI652_01210 [Acidobacteriota bacterium]
MDKMAGAQADGALELDAVGSLEHHTHVAAQKHALRWGDNYAHVRLPGS